MGRQRLPSPDQGKQTARSALLSLRGKLEENISSSLTWGGARTRSWVRSSRVEGSERVAVARQGGGSLPETLEQEWWLEVSARPENSPWLLRSARHRQYGLWALQCGPAGSRGWAGPVVPGPPAGASQPYLSAHKATTENCFPICMGSSPHSFLSLTPQGDEVTVCRERGLPAGWPFTVTTVADGSVAMAHPALF